MFVEGIAKTEIFLGILLGIFRETETEKVQAIVNKVHFDPSPPDRSPIQCCILLQLQVFN